MAVDEVKARAALSGSPPADASGWRQRAESLAAAGDLEAAAAAWREVLAREPDSLRAHESLGACLAESGRPAEAALHLLRCAEAAPQAVKSWRRLAQVLEAAGDEAAAIRTWRRVLEMAPEDKKSHFRLADLLYRQGDSAGAISHRQQARGAGGDKVKAPKRLLPPPATGEAEAVYAELRRIADSGRPIVIGPWQGEVGYELLYWIPFLRRALGDLGVARERVRVVSRGGAACWYAGLVPSGGYVDLFDHLAPARLVELAEERRIATGSDKADLLSRWDREILAQTGTPEDAEVIHPQLMFELFKPYWKGAAPFTLYTGNTAFAPMAAPDHPIAAALPGSFTAVKFYSRASFPMTEENAAFVRRFVLDLAQCGPVVFMDTAVEAHDHEDFRAPDHPDIVSIRGQVRPADNLLAQSAVVARARQVFCTYGGFAYLPLWYRRPVVSFFSGEGHMLHTHARAVFHLASQMDTLIGILEARPLGEVAEALERRIAALQAERDRAVQEAAALRAQLQAAKPGASRDR